MSEKINELLKKIDTEIKAKKEVVSLSKFMKNLEFKATFQVKSKKLRNTTVYLEEVYLKSEVTHELFGENHKLDSKLIYKKLHNDSSKLNYKIGDTKCTEELEEVFRTVLNKVSEKEKTLLK